MAEVSAFLYSMKYVYIYKYICAEYVEVFQNNSGSPLLSQEQEKKWVWNILVKCLCSLNHRLFGGG